MKAGEFFVEIKLKRDKFTKELNESKKSLKVFALEALATTYIIDRFVEKSTNAATRLTNLGRASGIAAQRLKQYGLAATLTNAGISAEDASAQIADFAKNLYSIQRFGEGNFGGFNKLQAIGKGIQFYGKQTEEVIDEIKGAIRGLNDQEATNILGAFGFSPEMLPLFRQTRQEMEKITASRMMSDDQIKQLEEADRIINAFKQDLISLQNTIVVSIAPAIKSLSESFAGLAKDGNLEAVSIVLKAMATSMQLIAASASSLHAAAKIIGTSISGADSDVQQQVNSEIREENSNRWKRTWKSLRKLWGTTEPATPQAPQSGGAAGLNNWGNLRGSDGSFRSFASPQEGMNALVSDIKAKVAGRSDAMRGKYGAGYMPTLEKLISTYAPPSENDTRGYVDFVSKQTGIDSNRGLNQGDVEKIVAAIAKMEGNKNISVNMTNNIQGSDGRATAGMIGDELNRTLKHAMADQNNGAF